MRIRSQMLTRNSIDEEAPEGAYDTHLALMEGRIPGGLLDSAATELAAHAFTKRGVKVSRELMNWALASMLPDEDHWTYLYKGQPGQYGTNALGTLELGRQSQRPGKILTTVWDKQRRTCLTMIVNRPGTVTSLQVGPSSSDLQMERMTFASSSHGVRTSVYRQDTAVLLGEVNKFLEKEAFQVLRDRTQLLHYQVNPDLILKKACERPDANTATSTSACYEEVWERKESEPNGHLVKLAGPPACITETGTYPGYCLSWRKSCLPKIQTWDWGLGIIEAPIDPFFDLDEMTIRLPQQGYSHLDDL